MTRPARELEPAGTISITTDAANNQAKGTITVGVNGSHHDDPPTAKRALSNTGNGTSRDTMTSNDPTRPSTVQVGGQHLPKV